jgi:hypothetical protein
MSNEYVQYLVLQESKQVKMKVLYVSTNTVRTREHSGYSGTVLWEREPRCPSSV